MNKLTLILSLFCATTVAAAPQSYTVKSPNTQSSIVITTDGDQLKYSVEKNGHLIIAPSAIGMTINSSQNFGQSPKVTKATSRSVDGEIVSPFYKREKIDEKYNELLLTMKGNYALRVRAYDDGVAYRFETKLKGDATVDNEQFEIAMPADFPVTIAYANRAGKQDGVAKYYFNSFENTYVTEPVSKVDNEHLAFLPLMFDAGNNVKVVVTEVDLKDYPGMYLYNPKGDNSLTGNFAPVPKSREQGGHNNLQMLVTERENYIAKCNGTRSYPWRAFAIADRDVELANNDLVYKLAEESKITDISWIKPGKVAWDWWNAWNLYGVDFKTGVNNDTYKYYIDFAAKNGIEYVILDEGWAVNKKADLFMVVPEINLEELIAYGAERNVGIVLWAGYYAMDRDMERVCKHYADMGIKGFKVDFMDHDDQLMVDFYYRMAETAARHKLMVDYHGGYKPTGLNRTYPNVVNYEGVFGLEQLKWAKPEVDLVTYDVTMPFIRMVAGPVDYTQGAMKNASKKNFKAVYSEPMSQGTRCRQMGQYVIFESPFNMLCDSPSNYMKEQECTDAITAVPTVWNETVGLDGKVGEFITMARRSGDVWYVGGLTNWDARTVSLNLGFIGDGDFRGELFRDGVNADKVASDYKREVIDIPSDRKLDIKMMQGGGFLMKITRK